MYDVVFCYRKGVLKAKFQDWLTSRGLCPGVYVRQSWNLVFKSAMCDSVGFIRPCHWTGDSDLGGYVRGVMSGHRSSRLICRRYVCTCRKKNVMKWTWAHRHSRRHRLPSTGQHCVALATSGVSRLWTAYHRDISLPFLCIDHGHLRRQRKTVMRRYCCVRIKPRLHQIHVAGYTSCIHLYPLSPSTCILYRRQNCRHGDRDIYK